MFKNNELLRIMIRSHSRMYKMIEDFKENLNGLSINEYFQVPMKIIIKHPDMTNITCKFLQKKQYNELYIKLDLPFELNCLILSYLYYYSYGEYKIIVPNDYPFKPPLWVLIDTNEPYKPNIYNKYKKAEIYHNIEYRNSWETSISFEKDILYMIEQLNT